MRPVVAKFVASALLLAGACSSTNHSPLPPGAQPDGGAGHDGGSMHDDAGKPPTQLDDASTPGPDAGPAAQNDAGTPDAGGGPAPVTKTSLIWVWLGYGDALNAIAEHAKSFTHVSPALYNLNFDYQSGPPHRVNDNDDYDGMSSKDIAQKVHDAGLKVVPLMYAGAGNFGTDQGIQNVLNDANGAQQNFIDALVEEGMNEGFDGWNLDWEVSDTSYDQYGQKLIDFLGKLKSALNSKGMILTFDAAGWYTKQCNGSGGGGLVDLAAMGDVVDLAIFEAYSGALGSPNSCEGVGNGGFDCDGNFAEALNALCSTRRDSVSVGLISPGSNGFAIDALQAADTYGYKSVSVWPDDQEFLKADGMPDGATWYSVLEDFLSR